MYLLCIIVTSIKYPKLRFMNNNYSPQLNTAVNAALLAGKTIMRFYSRLENLRVMSKVIMIMFLKLIKKQKKSLQKL